MVTAIKRTAWQDPNQPVTGPARRQPFRQGVIHWEGAPDRTTLPADIAAFLRNMQASYLAHRQYSLGYGYAVVSQAGHPADGTLWEIRGTDLNMASNPGRKLGSGNANDWTGSVIIMGPGNKPATPKAIQAVRTLFWEWHAEAGTQPVRPIPHMDLDWTSCAGPYFTDQVRNGTFDPTPTNNTHTGDIDMNLLPTPVRMADTRIWPGKVSGTFQVDLPANLKDAKAVFVTVTVVDAEAPGFITLWADGPVPTASNLNYHDGNAVANTTLVGVVNGKFWVKTHAKTHLILDIIATAS